MDTSKDLVALLKNLSEGIDKNHFSNYNESQVSQQFVIPILEKLGWNIKNAKEVYPEFEIGDGKRVDYALFNDENNNKKPKVIIEVKRINADLDNAVEQLRNYANIIEDEQEDPFVCVATNGINWRIYVYNPKNNSEIDLFLEITLDRPNKDYFISFLGKETINNAIDNLKNFRQYNIPNDEMQGHITKAWNSLFVNDFLQREIAKMINQIIFDEKGQTFNEKSILKTDFIKSKLAAIKPDDKDISKSKLSGNIIKIKKLHKSQQKVLVSCGTYKKIYKNHTDAAKDLLGDVIKVYGNEIIEKYIAEREKGKRRTYISKSQKELGDTTDSIWKTNNGEKDAIQWFVNFDLGRKQIKESILEPIFKLINKEVRYYEG